MKAYAIIGAAGLVAGLSVANIDSENAIADNRTQSIVVPTYNISFVRGSYEITEGSYDLKYSLSEQELELILSSVGFSGRSLEIARQIAFLESTNRPMALNSSSNCYGLFQINMSGSMGPDRRLKYGLKSNDDLFNPVTNAQIAYKMSDGGKNWTAWSTYKGID
jgi:hypothetical protein